MTNFEDPRLLLQRRLRATLAMGAFAVLSAAVLTACQPAIPDAQASAAVAQEAPTVPVARVTAAVMEAALTQVARVEAAQHVELQARVSGPIDAVLFREGEAVRAGQPLFQIDPRPYDTARARAELAAAEADLPALAAALAVSVHRLAVLLGASPSGYEAPAAVSRSPHPVALRLPEPAQWAAQRPDLQAAEARLGALALDVEAVRSEFLPRLSVVGVLGVVAGSVSGLGAAGAASWFVAPGLSVPVFDHARIKARLQAARAGKREARQAVVAEQLARKRFEAGGSDSLELLDAQRSTQWAETELSVALTVQHQQVVALQRAWGARFVSGEEAAATTVAARIARALRTQAGA